MAFEDFPGELGPNPLVKVGKVVTRLLNDQGAGSYELSQARKDTIKSTTDSVNSNYDTVTPALIEEYQTILDTWIDDVYNGNDGVTQNHLAGLNTLLETLMYNYLGEDFSEIPYVDQQSEPENPYN